MSVIKGLEEINDLSIDEKKEIAVEEFDELYNILENKYANLFDDIYQMDDGFVLFLFDLMRVGITADSDLMREEIDLIQYILKESGDTDFEEDAVIDLFRGAERHHYELVQRVFALMEPDESKHIVAFLAAIVSIDGRLDPSEVAFIDSLFEKV